ncbi:hypothetical protein NPIL_689421, partial [Nephila pilipes]
KLNREGNLTIHYTIGFACGFEFWKLKRLPLSRPPPLQWDWDRAFVTVTILSTERIVINRVAYFIETAGLIGAPKGEFLTN